jgi:hypothetical protein
MLRLALSVLLMMTPILATAQQDVGARLLEARRLFDEPKTITLAEEDCVPNLLLCGEIVESSLTSRDCDLESDGFVDFWFFPGYQGDLVAAATLSDDFDPFISMLTPTPASVWDWDQGVAGEAVAVASFLHRTGAWSIGVASLGTSRTTGDYLLLLSCGISSQCRANPSTLCLGPNNRYRVQVGYYNQFSDSYGFGGQIKPARTTESGYFYFGSDPSNVELMVKILDFGGVKKVFWGQLTNLQYKIVVTDMATDDSETYISQPSACGGTDANAFADLSNASIAKAASCRPGKNTACLMKGRFELTGTWRNQYNGTSGQMGASRISDLTSSFFFGSAGNVELLAKVADLGNRIGFFYGAMSDLEYTLNVRDTVTGEVKTYHNPPGRYCGGLADLPK